MKKQLALVLMLAAIGACKGRDKAHQQSQKGLDLSTRERSNSVSLDDPPPPE
jgi:hypothetical protein